MATLQEIKSCAPSPSVCGNRSGKPIRRRTGGDEFVVLLEDVRDIEVAQRVASTITTAIERPVNHEDHSYIVGASIGIKMFPDAEENPGALLAAADMVMYVEKTGNHGRQLRETPELATV